jgi:hypothetical protein
MARWDPKRAAAEARQWNDQLEAERLAYLAILATINADLESLGLRPARNSNAVTG